MKLSKKDLEELEYVRYNLKDSEGGVILGRGWSPHGYKEHYPCDVRSLLRIIDKLMKENDE